MDELALHRSSNPLMPQVERRGNGKC